MTDDPIGQAADHLRRRAIEAGREFASNEANRVTAIVGELEERLADLGRLISRLEEAVATRSGKTEPVAHTHGLTGLPPISMHETLATPLHEKSDEPAPLPETWTLVSLCEEAGLEVIDRRDVPGGSLWVIGDEVEARALFNRLATTGIKFTFSPTGSRATGRMPGWFTKSRR